MKDYKGQVAEWSKALCLGLHKLIFSENTGL